MERSSSIEASLKTLSDKSLSTAQRLEAYSSISMKLKAMSSSAPMPDDIFNYRKLLLEVVLSDISSGICSTSHNCIVPHSLQTLGYMLFNEHLARDLDFVEVSKIVKALCSLVLHEATPKVMCTRALWCLASQNVEGKYMAELVKDVIDTVSHVLCSSYLISASLVSESVSILEKLSFQCKETFLMVCPSWYMILITAIFSKHCKVHQKAIQIAINSEDVLKANQNVAAWLHKELRTHLISAMTQALTAKCMDNHVLMKIWAHFVTVLGKSFLKSGTLLNEMLKIVESGFKHKSIAVQVEAYRAWKALVDSFALDKDLLMNQKRLKLVMMPLMSSAVKQRCHEVDAARVATWWHLVQKLQMSKAGSAKSRLFHTVCYPFLLFCLGLDPKTELSSLLLQLVQDLESSHRKSSPLNAKSATGHLTPHHLFILLANPASLGCKAVDAPSGQYPSLPSQALLSTGCHAFLQLIGTGAYFEKSLIKTNLLRNTAFEINRIPLDIVLFILFYLEGLISYHGVLLPAEESGAVQHFCNSIVSSLASGHVAPPKASAVLLLLLQMLLRMSFISRDILSEVLSSIADFPCTLLSSSSLCHLHLTSGGELVESDFCEAMLSLVLTVLAVPEKKQSLVTLCGWVFDLAIRSHQETPSDDARTHMDFLLPLLTVLQCHISTQELSRLKIAGEVWIEVVEKMVLNLKEKSEASNLSSGTPKPNLDVIHLALQFPFVNWIAMGNVNTSQMLSSWKKLFCLSQAQAGHRDEDCTRLPVLIARNFVQTASDVLHKHIQHQSCHDESLTSEVHVLSSYSTELDCFLFALASATQILLEDLFQLPGQGHQALTEAVQSTSALMAWLLTQVVVLIYKAKSNVDSLAAPKVVCLGVRHMFAFVSTSDVLELLSRNVAFPFAELMKAVFTNSDYSTRVRANVVQPCNLAEEVYLVWKSICTSFQKRYNKSFSTKTLELLSPIFEVAFVVQQPVLVKETIEFWCSSFGKASHLEYSSCLRSALTDCIQSKKHSFKISIPGLDLHSGGSDDHDVATCSSDDASLASTKQQLPTEALASGKESCVVASYESKMPTSKLQEEMASPSPEAEVVSAPAEFQATPSLSVEGFPSITVILTTATGSGEALRQQEVLEKSEFLASSSSTLDSCMEIDINQSAQINSQSEHPSGVNEISKKPNVTSQESDSSVSFSVSAEKLDVSSEVSSITSGLDVTVISPSQSPCKFKNGSTGQSTCQESPVTVVVKPPVSPVMKRLWRSKRNSSGEAETESSPKSKRRKLSNTPELDVDYTRPHRRSKRASAIASKQRKMTPVQLLPPVIHKKPICLLGKVKKGQHNLTTTTSAQPDVSGSKTSPLPSVPPVSHVSGIQGDMNVPKSCERSFPYCSASSPVVAQVIASTTLSYVEAQNEASLCSVASSPTFLSPTCTLTPVTTPSNGQSPFNSPLNSLGTAVVSPGSELVPSPLISPGVRGIIAVGEVDSANESASKDIGSGATCVTESIVGKNAVDTPADEMVSNRESEGRCKELHEPPNEMVTSETTKQVQNTVSEFVCLLPVTTQGSNSSDKNVSGDVEDTHELGQPLPNKLPEGTTESSVATDDQPSGTELNLVHDIFSKHIPDTSIKLVATSASTSSTEVPVDSSEASSVPGTPTRQVFSLASPKTTPVGILKHTSQFDSPSSASKGLRVQFANPVVVHKQELPATPLTSFKPAKQARSGRKDSFTSRRTLELAGSVLDNLGSGFPLDEPQASPSSDPVFPNLKSCLSPVEQILPALSPSGRFSHGLYNVVCAKNIHTVGDLSSLTEQEIQTLPIKSPKVNIVKNALQKFEVQVQQRQKRKPAKDDSPTFPNSKRLAAESEAPIPSQQADSVDVSEECSTEESDIPSVALYCADQYTGVASNPEDTAVDALDHGTVSVEESALDLAAPMEVDACSNQEKVVMEQNVPTVGAGVSEDVVQPLITERSPSTDLTHDDNHSQILDEEGAKVEGTEGQVSHAASGENSIVSHVDHEPDKPELHEEPAGMDDAVFSHEQSSSTDIETTDRANLDMCIDAEEEMSVGLEDGESDSPSSKSDDNADVNVTDSIAVPHVDTGNSQETGDELCPNNLLCNLETLSACHSPRAEDQLNDATDASSNPVGVNLPECDDQSSEGDHASSHVRRDAIHSLEEEQASQELFPEPQLVSEKGSEDVATAGENAKEEELDMDVVDRKLELNSRPFPVATSEPEPGLQAELCPVVSSANSVVLDSGSENIPEEVNSNPSLDQQQSSTSTIVRSNSPVTIMHNRCSSVPEHDFTSLAQLTADNLELLESNLERVVPASVGHRLYQSMLKVLSRFPGFFEKS